MTDTAPRLEMRGIRKAFGGVDVLREVELTVAAGEVLALLGSNGAGKSTLVKILAGSYGRDGGTVRLDGAEVSFDQPRQAVAAGVRLLPQEISVIPDMTVAENICIGDLPMRAGPGFRVVDTAAMRRQAEELLQQLGYPGIDPGARVKGLSVPEQRIVEIARALAGRARVLIMDEPTASLTEQEAATLFAIIRRLKAQGVAVIYISHYLSEVFEVSDRIAVLRDGRNAGSFRTHEATPAEVLRAMLGGVVDDLYGAGPAVPPGEAVLAVEGLRIPGEIEDVDLTVRAGEIVGLFGLVGSGVETLGRALYGALGPVAARRVAIGGAPYVPRNPQAGKAAGIGFIAAERKREGIVAELTVRENIALPFLERFRAGPFMDVAAERRHAEGWIDQLGIRTRGSEQRLRTLSGGNQQKVCIARWLVDGMRLLILEEPTRGVDVGARREIYAELRRLADAGRAILVLSSDVEEVAGLCDRAIVLDRGRAVAEFSRGREPAELMAAAGGPAVAEHGELRA